MISPRIAATTLLQHTEITRDRREQILDRFESSGMSGQSFAGQIGVKYSTFASWVQKRRRARGAYADSCGEGRRAVKHWLSCSPIFQHLVQKSLRWANGFALLVHKTVRGLASREELAVASHFVVEVKASTWLVPHI